MKRHIYLIILYLLSYISLHASIVLPEQISSHMVLQQQADVCVWGKATPHRIVSVWGDWMSVSSTAQVSADSTWTLTIPTPAGTMQPHTLTVSEQGGDSVTLTDVLIGEVWLCSGQSNMEMPLNGFWNCPVNNANEEIATSGEWGRRIRMVTILKTGATTPQEWVKGEWHVPSPDTAPWMSATGWFFAKMLTRTLQVPVGIVSCAWGGASVEGWSPRELLSKYPDINLERQLKEGWNGKWWEYYTPLVMYNGMFHPVRHYTVRGILWYQGEANVGKEYFYAERLRNMAETWRRDMRRTAEQLPFFLVQIAPWAGYGDSDSAGRFRDSQKKAATLIPNSGIICTIDLVKPCERDQIHPAEKQKVGERLAYMALNRTYGYRQICCDSPEYDHHKIRGCEVEVFFRHADEGLSPWQDIRGFEVCGADGVYHEARARLNEPNKSVIVTAEAVTNPVGVRYCYRAFLSGNLRNHRNLPVFPFSSN